MTNTDSAAGNAKRPQVSEKDYVDATGKVVDIAEATGLRYKSLADGKDIIIDVSGMTPGVTKMLALFGTSTLATNVASQNRNADAPLPSDIDAIVERFAAMTDGDWGVQAGGGTGMRIDTEALAEAIRVIANPPDMAPIKVALEEDASYRRAMRNHPDLMAKYDELVRAKKTPDPANVKPLADLLANVPKPKA